MELNYNNFDDTSKKEAEELIKENKKFNNLIHNLQIARDNVEKNNEFTQTLIEEVKK